MKIQIHEWFMTQLNAMEPESGEHTDLIYWGSAKLQVMFMRDRLPTAKTFDPGNHARTVPIHVVSEHRSKSVLLPVYLVDVGYGCHVMMRGNFHDWKLSVVNEQGIDFHDFEGLWNPESDYLTQPVYFEGFPEDQVFPIYAESDKRRFSLMLPYSEHVVWTFFFLLRRQLERCAAF